MGRNEALFRTVNERVKHVNDAFSLVLEQSDFVCECGRGDCVEHIRMTIGEYERIRADGALFAIVPGHEEVDVERVVEQNQRFAVVRKHEGGPATLARNLDPRS
jgi:hypothetical protein